MTTINIAITGCGHGELDAYYRMCDVFEQQGKKIDLLIITGDFQAMRNQQDLGCMKCPQKYMFMRDFFKYYSGEKIAPVLTIYVGGNHEATNYHRELHYGGWVAPNIYYMGCSNIIHYKGLTIGGISGIFKAHDYEKGYYETIPFQDIYTEPASAFHYRHLEILKLLAYSSPIDIMISHDWPSEIFQYGDVPYLIRRKPHFQPDMNAGCLGSIPLMTVLNELKPTYWFAAHLHVKYAAIYPHKQTQSLSTMQSTETIVSQHNDSKSDSIPTDQPKKESVTKFLALDKCLKGRDFMQVITLSIEDEYKNDNNLYYDPEWLAIVKQSHTYVSSSINGSMLPSSIHINQDTQDYIDMLLKRENSDKKHGLKIKTNFKQIAPCYYGLSTDNYDGSIAENRGNNQTDEYLELLALPHKLTIPFKEEPTEKVEDPNELDLDDIYNVCNKHIKP